MVKKSKSNHLQLTDNPDLIVNKLDYSKNTSEISIKKKKLLETLPFDKIFKWIEKSYSAQVPKLLANIPTNYSEGMIKRVMLLSTIKNLTSDNGLSGHIVVMKLYDSLSRKETNYGILFCNTIDKLPEKIINAMFTHDQPKFGNYVLMYLSTGPSLISCDGEYRGRLIRFEDLLRSKNMFSYIWNEIEEYMNQAKKKRSWSIYATYIYPDKRTVTSYDDLELIVKSELLPTTMLNMAWFQAIYNEKMQMSETHMNKTFREIILSEYEIDLEFLNELIKKYGAEDVERFKVSISNIIHNIFGSNKKRYLQSGFKMIPLNVSEVQNPFDIRYKPWREYYITTRCSDLIPNQIAPGFPVISNYYYVRNTKKGLFDNKSQYERIKNSELAMEILKTLKEAQQDTYFASSSLVTVNKTTEQVRQWVSNKFKKLSDKISDPINYTIDELIMSDVTFILASEFVGKTFADTIQLQKTNKIFDSNLGNPFSDGGYDYFAKYMFEICYSLLTLNKRIGIIHGDFHLNNATIGYLYQSIPNASVAYFVNPDAMYVFPNNGYFSCIIDFSRSIVDPDRYRELEDKSLSSKLTKNEPAFTSGQIHNLLNIYIQLFTNKSKQYDELLILFKNNFSAVFKLLTCIDLYMFCVRLGRMLGDISQERGKVSNIEDDPDEDKVVVSDKKNNSRVGGKQTEGFSISDKSLELIDKIIRLTESYIASDMNHLINDPEDFGDKILKGPYPIETIIGKCFPEFKDGSKLGNIGSKTNKSNMVVTDCYNIDNEWKYSLNKYDTFPECIQSNKYEQDGKLIDVEIVSKNRSESRYAYEKMIADNYQTIKFLGDKYDTELIM
jgi:hypothetical protein